MAVGNIGYVAKKVQRSYHHAIAGSLAVSNIGYVPKQEHAHLLVIYGKHEANELSPDELATVRSLVKATLEEYRRRESREPDTR